MTAAAHGPSDEPVEEGTAPLDLLLTEAASGVLSRFIPGKAVLRLARGLAQQPKLVAEHASKVISEYGRIVVGRSTIAPSPRDRRFAEPAWTNSRLLRSLVQAYLVTSDHAQRVLGEVELDWRDAERLQFMADNVIDALAPSNVPPLNPLWWKAIVDTGGRSIVTGARHFLDDMSQAPRVPTMVDVEPFQVGRNIAATPGSVVFRNEVLELIQYTPTTETVGRIPLMMIPPVINKYYLLDLAPGRSLVEFLVGKGQQVFAVSWRNPDVRHREWDFDRYGAAILEALDVVTAVTGASRTHLLSLCSGGALSSMLAAHLADVGAGDRIATFSLGVAVLDQAKSGTVSALADERTAKMATAKSSAKGYLDGAALAEVFAWLRPNDLIWNYWVNNYLQGRKPAAFDILYWNADTTRMTAALHRDFIELFTANKLADPGTATMLGSPVDLNVLKADAYIVAGVSDHICPWQNCYRSTQLLGGDTRFILSSSGHVACIVNPPGNPKASYRVAGSNPEDAQAWLEDSEKVSGTWWDDYAAWLAERNDGQVPAPQALGDEDHPPRDTAPGTYVYDH